MQTIAYIDMPRHTERRVSLSKLGVLLTSLALWAMMIGGVALVLR